MPRAVMGKSVKTLRQAGFLPAVLYGYGMEAQALCVAYRDFEHTHKEAGESTLIRLIVDGAAHTVLIHDIAYDPLGGKPIHADFYAVRMDKTLRVSVPIVFGGESPVVKNEGGILVKVAQELEVEALPVDLPHELHADLARLNSFDARITAGDVGLPAGVFLVGEPDEVVAIVSRPRSEEEIAALAEAPIAEAAEVKTEREVKKAAEVEGEAAETDEAR